MLALAASVVAAPARRQIGYAQATDYFKKDSRPTLYQPLNLLDARDATAWCSATVDPLNEQLTFGFNGPVQHRRAAHQPGNNFDANTWNDSPRAKKLVIRSGKQSQTFTIEDKRGAQSVTLNPPMLGSRFTIEMLDQLPGRRSRQRRCASPTSSSSRRARPLNGPGSPPSSSTTSDRDR